jgi:hypothetical protein
MGITAITVSLWKAGFIAVEDRLGLNIVLGGGNGRVEGSAHLVT